MKRTWAAITWDEEPEVLGTSSAGEYYVRHMIGGRSDMLWLNERDGWTDDYTVARKFDETGARLKAEGFRVTYKDEDRYVFDVVAVEMAKTLVEAAALKIEEEKRERAAAAVGDPDMDYDADYEGYDVDSDGYFVDEDGDRIHDPDYEDGYARKGHHREALAKKKVTGSPSDWRLVPRYNGDDAVVGTFTARYGDISAKLGKHSSEGNGFQTTTEWIIEWGDGVQAKVFDDRQTEAYDDALPTVEAVHDSSVSITWSIAGDRRRVEDLLGR